MEFVRVDAFGGDPSAFVIFHQDGGFVYAGSRMWMGHGDRSILASTLIPGISK